MSVETAPSGAGAAIASAGPAAIEAGGTPFRSFSPISSIESTFGSIYKIGTNTESSGLDRFVSPEDLADTTVETSFVDIPEVGHTEIPQGIVNSFNESEATQRPFGNPITDGEINALYSIAISNNRLPEEPNREFVGTFNTLEIEPETHGGSWVVTEAEDNELKQVLATQTALTEAGFSTQAASQITQDALAANQGKVIAVEEVKRALGELEALEEEAIVIEEKRIQEQTTSQNTSVASESVMFVEDSEAEEARLRDLGKEINKQEDGEIPAEKLTKVLGTSEHLSEVIRKSGRLIDGGLMRIKEGIASFGSFNSKDKARKESEAAVEAYKAVKMGKGTPVTREDVAIVVEQRGKGQADKVLLDIIASRIARLRNSIQAGGIETNQGSRPTKTSEETSIKIVGTKVEMATTRKEVTQVTREKATYPVVANKPLNLTRRVRLVDTLIVPRMLKLAA